MISLNTSLAGNGMPHKTEPTQQKLFAKFSSYFFILSFLCTGILLQAEGIKELAPNQGDVAALNIGNEEYYEFAEFGSSDANARLYINIQDPSTESIHLGFSRGVTNQITNPRTQMYTFYIYDQGGTLIYTHTATIDETNANLTDDENGRLAAISGPNINGNMSGYDPITIPSSMLPSAGDYYIEFEVIDRLSGTGSDFLLINQWDITVATDTEIKDGRVWSYNWGLFAPHIMELFDRPFNGQFYVCADDEAAGGASYITKIDFNGAGFRPGAFNVAFNSKGPRQDLDFPESAKSLWKPDQSMAPNLSEYKIFLNNPEDICIPAAPTQLDLQGVTRCNDQPDYCIQITSSKPGEVLVLIDLDGNDLVFNENTADRLISYEVMDSEVGTSICINWDGLDGLGNMAPNQVTLVLSYEEGRYNFPIYDAEFMTEGFTLESIAPPSSEDVLIYFDDRDIERAPCMGCDPPGVLTDAEKLMLKDGRAGCIPRSVVLDTPERTIKCHSWDNYRGTTQDGYGNLNTINTWWYADRVVKIDSTSLPLFVACDIQGPAGLCPGDSDDLTISISGIAGDAELNSVNWSGPNGAIAGDENGATADEPGTYTANVVWSTETGETCETECTFDVAAYDAFEEKIDTTLGFGEVFEFDGVIYDQTIMNDVREYQTVNGCDSIYIICVTVETPDVNLTCTIDGPDALCAGDTGQVTLSTQRTTGTGPTPTIDSIVWTGVVSSMDSLATAGSGSLVTATVYYTNLIGPNSTTCELSIDENPEFSIKVDTLIPFGGVFEANGVIYDATTVDSVSLTTVEGCDSLVIYCVTVEIPDVTLTCELAGPDGLCNDDAGNVTLSLTHTPTTAPFPTLVGTSYTDPNGNTTAVSGDNFDVVGGGTYTVSVQYINLTGDTLVSTCSIDIEAYPDYDIKIDTLIPFGGVFEANGVTYDQTGNYPVNLTTVNDCDSLVTYCVTVEIPDVTLTCDLSGPAGLCGDDTGTVEIEITHSPASAPLPQIIETLWVDPVGNIENVTGQSFEVSGGGTYGVSISYINLTGDTLVTECNIDIESYPEYEIKVDTFVLFGEVFEANGVIYDTTGNYPVTLTSADGCDSLVTYCVEVEIPDVTLTCQLDGPAGVCANETGLVTLTTSFTPANAPAPVINSVIWSSNVNSSTDNDAVVSGGDTYTVNVNYTTVRGDVKDATCEIAVDQYPVFEVVIDTIKETGQSITINGETYTDEGQYIQSGSTTNGCDSTVIINVICESALLCYDLNDCKSSDYSRFTPKVSEDFDCAQIMASTVYRVNPQVNAHSCTEGVNGSEAMCISSVEACAFSPGHERSAIIDVVITPEQGKAVRISSMNFFERAPEIYQWNVGHSGLNNYPTKYGVRVLKNGVEIFRADNEDTSEDWTEERFSFAGFPEFEVDEPSMIRFEFLGYCVIGNESDVTAWDLDEIKINASCVNSSGNRVDIAGLITDVFGEPLENVEVALTSDNQNLGTNLSLTDDQGQYAFESLLKGYDYQINPELDTDHLKDVNTLDLILIQRHILGLDQFNHAYQMIAADANRSGSVSALDIIELRKLILHINDELPNNTSYRFGRSDQELDMNNPWAISESMLMRNASASYDNADFDAVKIGDVSSFNKSNDKNGSVGYIDVDNQQLFAGQSTALSLHLDNENSIQGAQWAIDMKNFNQFEVVGLGKAGETHYYDAKDDVIRFIWTADYAQSFELKVTPNISGTAQSLLSMNVEALEPLTFNGETLTVNNLEFRINNEQATEERLTVSPNPFVQSLNINISTVTSGQANVEVMDLAGRLLYKNSTELNEGENIISLTKSDIQNYQGVVVLRVTNNENIMTRKILSL